MAELEQNAEGQEPGFSPYGEEYRRALRDLEAENVAQQAEAVADMMNTRLDDAQLDPPKDGSATSIYRSDGEYDEVDREAIKRVLQAHGADPDKFRTPRKRQDKDGLPDMDVQLFDIDAGTLTVIYDPWQGRRDFDEQQRVIPQESTDWRVLVSARIQEDRQGKGGASA